jgi:hypothetical protein
VLLPPLLTVALRTALAVAFRRVLALLLRLLLLLFVLLFQLVPQFLLAELGEGRQVLLVGLAARAAHVQDDFFVGVHFDEIATLISEVAGVAALFARRPGALLRRGQQMGPVFIHYSHKITFQFSPILTSQVFDSSQQITVGAPDSPQLAFQRFQTDSHKSHNQFTIHAPFTSDTLI